MVDRIATVDNRDAVAIAWYCVGFLQSNARNIADNIGRMIADEPDERKRDMMLSPYFTARRVQHRISEARQ
jgi:hypothetical protein